MKKMTIAMVAVALALAAIPPASVSATPEPIQMLAISTTGALVPDHQGGGYQEERCDGQVAVLVIDLPGCDFTDDHLVGPEWIITIGFLSVNAGNQAPLPLTGTLRAHLTHASGEVDFRCTWNAGTFAGCQIFSAQWPLPGATYDFACHSTEGSLGFWGECFHGHT